ncbi:MAG: TraR/DksA family transcriptional regulator, partial [Candidatus Omnitrophota bacterium]|nr:TraR/DksA family transcriptional regulator [Candidatus Omnitrophota bacterium]
MPRKSTGKKKNPRVSGKVARKPAKPEIRKFRKQELLDFKKLILKRKDEILDDIKHISDDTLKKSQKEASGDISGYTYHMADVATDTYDREFSLGLASNERQFLYELDDAMKKIDDGAFGICENCKSPISKNRLKAVPYARLC